MSGGRIRLAVAAAVGALAAASAAGAAPTHVMVRGRAADAKFIGTSMGGVEVTLTDAAGKVLAKGMTTGGTGDTALIVTTPHARNARITDDKTAGFDAIVDIDKPTLVTATARGPMGKPGAAVSVSSTRWVIPGRDVAGDGWVLEFPGLVVEPAASVADGIVKVSAKVTLMCGCPIEPGGVWAAEGYKVEARLLAGDRVVGSLPLTYAGAPSQFAGSVSAPSGAYRLQVTAVDDRTPNVGVADIPVTVP